MAVKYVVQMGVRMGKNLELEIIDSEDLSLTLGEHPVLMFYAPGPSGYKRVVVKVEVTRFP